MTAPSHLSPCWGAFSTHFIIDAPGKWCDVVASVCIKTENWKLVESNPNINGSTCGCCCYAMPADLTAAVVVINSGDCCYASGLDKTQTTMEVGKPYQYNHASIYGRQGAHFANHRKPEQEGSWLDGTLSLWRFVIVVICLLFVMPPMTSSWGWMQNAATTTTAMTTTSSCSRSGE